MVFFFPGEYWAQQGASRANEVTTYHCGDCSFRHEARSARGDFPDALRTGSCIAVLRNIAKWKEMLRGVNRPNIKAAGTHAW